MPNIEENSPLILFTADVKVLFSSHFKDAGSLAMNGDQQKEDWLKLCEQATVEQDPEKLVALTREICRLLEEREKALKTGRSS
jgi:hypothetical protein